MHFTTVFLYHSESTQLHWCLPLYDLRLRIKASSPFERRSVWLSSGGFTLFLPFSRPFSML